MKKKLLFFVLAMILFQTTHVWGAPYKLRLAALGRVKTWLDEEILHDYDLDNEFDNILNNPISLISPLIGNVDADGYNFTDVGTFSATTGTITTGTITTGTITTGTITTGTITTLTSTTGTITDLTATNATITTATITTTALISQFNYAADAEASDTYVITLSPAPAAYTTGMVLYFKANTFNTGAATLNANSLGAKTIKKRGDFDLVTGDIHSGQMVGVIYDGTNMQLLVDPGEPVGHIMMFTTATAPSGYLECDGAAISRTTYEELFTVISDDYGVGDGSTTFNKPDLRGYFVRGYDHGAGVDPDAALRTDRGDSTTGDNVGTVQADEYESHLHTYDAFKTGSGATVDAGASYGMYEGLNSSISGGNETRPDNKYVMFCIKY